MCKDCDQKLKKDKCCKRGCRGPEGPIGPTGEPGPGGATGPTGTFNPNTCVSSLKVENLEGCNGCFQINSSYVSTNKVVFDAQGNTGTVCEGTGPGVRFYWNPTDGTIVHGNIVEPTSQIYGGVNANGSYAAGKVDGNTGTIRTGDESYGSQARGYTEGPVGPIGSNNCIIETGFQAIGSDAKGKVANDGSKIHTGDLSYGSVASGYARSFLPLATKGEILSGAGAIGSVARGFASNSIIKTGVNSYGSEASGRTILDCSIETGSNSYGSKALGFINGPGGSIKTGNSSFGSEALGFVATGGIIQTGANAYGAHASGYSDNGNVEALGLASMAHGRNVIANSNYSQALGNSVNTNGVEGVMIIGNNGWARTSGPTGGTNDYSFQLAGGGGAASGPGSGTDGIGLILKTTVPGANPHAIGIANEWVTGGADYAEYFEWLDGNLNSEDRCGYFVSLNVDKIQIANNDVDVIGIVSSVPGIVGDAAELSWKGTNAKDDFDRLLTRDSYYNPVLSYINSINYANNEIHDILNADSSSTVLSTLTNYYNNQLNLVNNIIDNNELENIVEKFNNILSPVHLNNLSSLVNNNEGTKEKIRDYVSNTLTTLREGLQYINPIQVGYHSDNFVPGQSYVPRSQRPEWSTVGLLGKIYVRDNGLCVPGGKCSCENGIAVHGSSWRVLSRKAPNIIQVLYR